MYSYIGSFKNCFIELIRPWKLLSFSIGMAWLIYGALNYHIADWDICISLIMGFLTYLFAPISVRIIIVAASKRPKNWFIWILFSLFLAWFVVDGSYIFYNNLVGNPIYRLANFYASSCLYFLAGTIWMYRGSLADLKRNFNDLL